jgi:Na+/H+-dicarboxylate symporter
MATNEILQIVVFSIFFRMAAASVVSTLEETPVVDTFR